MPLAYLQKANHEREAIITVNKFRDQINFNPNLDIDQRIDNWLIPELEKILKTTSIKGIELNHIPHQYQLEQNYPNPFNPTTKITYELANSSHVVLDIFNVKGQRVKRLVDCYQYNGNHSIFWNGLNSISDKVSSGVYVYQISTNDFSVSRKMLFIQ